MPRPNQTLDLSLPYERPGQDFPGETLNGGPNGNRPILAVEVEKWLSPLVNLTNQLRWRDIASGHLISSDTEYSWDEGEYDIIDVTLRGSLTGDGYIGLEVYSGVGVTHRRQWTERRLNTGAVVSASSTDSGSMWVLARWSDRNNNTAYARIIDPSPSGTTTLTFQGTGFRAASAADDRMWTEATGDVSNVPSGTTFNHMRVVPGGSASISSVWVCIEGHRA